MNEQQIAEFESRYLEDKKQEDTQEKERQYLLFRALKECKLSYDSVEEWKKQHKLGVDFTLLRNKPYIWRVLSLAEYTGLVAAVTKLNGDEDDLKVRIAQAALLVPSIEDFKVAPAGLASTLANAILRSSGFQEQVVAFPV